MYKDYNKPSFNFNFDFGSLFQSKSKSEYKYEQKSKVKSESLSKSKAELKVKTTSYATGLNIAKKSIIGIAKFIALPIIIPMKFIEFLYEKRVEAKKIRYKEKIHENYKLSLLRKQYAEQLTVYANLFDAGDMMPNMQKYKLYKVLPFDGLVSQYKILLSDIKRQEKLNAIKRSMREGADGYNGANGGCYGYMHLFSDVTPRYSRYYDCADYQKELKRICRIYISNSKKIEEPMNNFKDIIKNYFAINSEKLQEIYDIQSNKVIKVLERIPKFGLIPKGLRVYEQWNLANCITKDFDDVTDKHVYRGIHQIAKKYDEQYREIINFALKHKNEFSKNNEYFTESMLQYIQRAHYEREKVYSVLYDRFITGGCNMKKICKKTKIRGGAGLARKAVMTMLPFVC